MPDQKPSVSRAVHYVSRGSADGVYGKKCRAATITDVRGDGRVDLFVMNPTGQFFDQDVRHDPGSDWMVPEGEDTPNLCSGLDHDGGTWHWPARV